MKDDKFILVLMAILAFVSFLVLKPFLTYVLLSIILTVVSYPLYERIKRKMFAPAAAILVIFMILLIIIVPSIYLTITIFIEARDLITNIGAIDAGNFQDLENTLERILGTELDFATPFRIWVLDLSTSIRSYLISNILIFTRTIFNFFGGVVLMLFIMFYLFIDGKRILEQIKRHLPLEAKHEDYLFHRAYHTIHGLFLGLFLTALIQGVLAGIAYFIFGVPHALLLGFITGVFSMIPFLGAPLVYGPAALFLLLQGNLFGGIGLLIVGFLLISNIDNVIRPRVVRLRRSVHPLYVILGVVGGISFLGFIGIVVGPLIFTLLQDVVEVYNMSKRRR